MLFLKLRSGGKIKDELCYILSITHYNYTENCCGQICQLLEKVEVIKVVLHCFYSHYKTDGKLKYLL